MAENESKRENGGGKSVCGGVKVRAGRRKTKWEQMALYLSSQNGFTLQPKFNLIAMKLRQIHLDTASKKS